MKKKYMLTFIAAFAVFIMLLSGCMEQLEAISLETFTRKMTDYGLNVSEKEIGAAMPDAVERLIAAESPNGWQIDYYVCRDNASAQALYESLRADMREKKGMVCSSQNVGVDNNMYFIFNSDLCGYIHIVDNCIIYSLTDSSTHLLEVCPALRELGIII